MYNFKEFEYFIIYITKYHEKIMKIWRNLLDWIPNMEMYQMYQMSPVTSEHWLRNHCPWTQFSMPSKTQVKTQRCYDVKMVQEKTSAVSQIHTQLKSLFLVLINIKQPFRMTCNWNIWNQRLITWKMYM